MKKYLVIGNPIDHSLSPKLHNYWFKHNNINAIYEKKKLENNDLQNIILDIKEGKLDGINVTVPFKQSIIQHVDELSIEAAETNSVNTIYLNNGKVIGHNTDIAGFELSIRYFNYDINNKKIFILGAGGVVPSIIYSLFKMKASEIIISNRTKEKAEKLKSHFNKINLVNWGEMPEFDMIINATSIGLKKNDEINLDFSNIGINKLFYDVIYNPPETDFLKKGKDSGNKSINGKMMFIYQAHQAFTIWHKQMPEISEEITNIL